MIFLLPLRGFSLIISLPSLQSIQPGATLRVQLAAEAHDPQLVSLGLHNRDTGYVTILIADVDPSDTAFVDLLVPDVPPLPRYAVQAFDPAGTRIADSADFEILPPTHTSPPALPATSITPPDNAIPSPISSSVPSISPHTAAANTTRSHRLSVGAIVGIVVGGSALAATAFICCCLRRRHSMRLKPFLLTSSNQPRSPCSPTHHLTTVTPFILPPTNVNSIRERKGGTPPPWISGTNLAIRNGSDVESSYDGAEKQLIEVEYTRQILEDDKQRIIARIERPLRERMARGLEVAVPSIRPRSTVSVRTSMYEDRWDLEYRLETLRAQVRQLGYFRGSLALTEPPPPIYTPTNGRGTGAV